MQGLSVAWLRIRVNNMHSLTSLQHHLIAHTIPPPRQSLHSLHYSMADRQQPHQLQVRPKYQQFDPKRGVASGPSTTKVLVVVTLVPVGGTLLALAGITLTGTLIGLTVSTPLFIIFSPILVPAALTIGLTVITFLASGAFGLTALSPLSWVVKYLRQTKRAVPEQLDYAKRRMQEMALHTDQKTKEVGHAIQEKAQDVKEGGRT